jgi:hypothetical protein
VHWVGLVIDMIGMIIVVKGGGLNGEILETLTMGGLRVIIGAEKSLLYDD